MISARLTRLFRLRQRARVLMTLLPGPPFPSVRCFSKLPELGSMMAVLDLPPYSSARPATAFPFDAEC
jgi:hypothetical protein